MKKKGRKKVKTKGASLSSSQMPTKPSEGTQKHVEMNQYYTTYQHFILINHATLFFLSHFLFPPCM